jgi:uncharacterized protein YueI
VAFRGLSAFGVSSADLQKNAAFILSSALFIQLKNYFIAEILMRQNLRWKMITCYIKKISRHHSYAVKNTDIESDSSLVIAKKKKCDSGWI